MELSAQSLIHYNIRAGVIGVHDVVYEWLRDQIVDEESIHRRLVSTCFSRYGKRLSGLLSEPYVATHIAYHMIQAGEAPSLCRYLTESPEWLDEKFKATGGDRSYANDLHLCISSLTSRYSVDDVPLFFRLCAAHFIMSIRASRYSDRDLASLVLIGRYDEAIREARLGLDYGRVVDNLVAVARALAEMKTGPFDLLDEATEYARKIASQEARDSALARIEAARLGGRSTPLDEPLDASRLDHHIRLLSLAYEEYRKSLRDVLVIDGTPEVYEAMVSEGFVDHAWSEIQRRDETLWAPRALSAIAYGFASRRNAGMAALVLDKLSQRLKCDQASPWDRSHMWHSTVHALRSCGRLDTSWEAVLRIEDSWWRARAWGSVADALGKAKRMTEADEAIERCIASYPLEGNSPPVEELARAMVSAGRTPPDDLLRRMIFRRVDFLYEVALALADADRPDDSAEILRRESGDHWDASRWLTSQRTRAGIALCASLSRAGRFREALNYADRFERPIGRLLGLRAITINDCGHEMAQLVLPAIRETAPMSIQGMHTQDAAPACAIAAEAFTRAGDYAASAPLIDACLTSWAAINTGVVGRGGPVVNEILNSLGSIGRLADFDRVSQRMYVIDPEPLCHLAGAGYVKEALQRAWRGGLVLLYERIAALTSSVEQMRKGFGIRLLYDSVVVGSWRSTHWAHPFSGLFESIAQFLKASGDVMDSPHYSGSK